MIVIFIWIIFISSKCNEQWYRLIKSVHFSDTKIFKTETKLSFAGYKAIQRGDAYSLSAINFQIDHPSHLSHCIESMNFESNGKDRYFEVPNYGKMGLFSLLPLLECVYLVVEFIYRYWRTSYGPSIKESYWIFGQIPKIHK